MQQPCGFFLKGVFVALLSWILLVTWGANYAFSGSKSGCVTCHTDLRMLKKSLSKMEKKESELIAGMG
jgi:hypothetical protein